MPVPDVMLPAKSMVRTRRVPVPADSVTPLADQFPPRRPCIDPDEPSPLTGSTSR
jgi:hypothetical protein